MEWIAYRMLWMLCYWMDTISLFYYTPSILFNWPENILLWTIFSIKKIAFHNILWQQNQRLGTILLFSMCIYCLSESFTVAGKNGEVFAIRNKYSENVWYECLMKHRDGMLLQSRIWSLEFIYKQNTMIS